MQTRRNRQLAETLGLRRIRIPRCTICSWSAPVRPDWRPPCMERPRDYTIVLETTAPGGQAGRSMRIENYLGFPIGITGSDLTSQPSFRRPSSGRTCRSAQALGFSFDGPTAVIHLEGDEMVRAKCLLIATGAEYRVLGVEGCDRYEGRGVYYAATPTEAQVCRGAEWSWSAEATRRGKRRFPSQARSHRLRRDSRRRPLQEHVHLPGRARESTPNIRVLCNTEVAGSKATGRWNRSN